VPGNWFWFSLDRQDTNHAGAAIRCPGNSLLAQCDEYLVWGFCCWTLEPGNSGRKDLHWEVPHVALALMNVLVQRAA
jgi:hypothetical protein